MDLLTRPQEPAAPPLPQDPAPGPTLGQRATSWFKERYLPYAEPDAYIQTLTLEAARVRAQKGPEALAGLDKYKPEDKAAVLKHLESFDRTIGEAWANPLQASTLFRETVSDKRLFEIAAKPGGIEILADLTKQGEDSDLYRAAKDAVNMANLARAGQITLAGKTQDPDAATGLPALAKGGAEWGADIQEGLRQAEERFGRMAPGGAAALSVGQRQARNAEYQAFAYEFGVSMAESAKRLKVDFAAPQEPQTVEEARKIFLDALPVAEAAQGEAIQAGATQLGFYGGEQARTVMSTYAKLLFAARQEMPEKAGALEEVQAVLDAYASGQEATGPAAKIAMATLKPAFWALEKIGRLDMAASALLYGSVGQTAPTKFRFADGSEFTDILDAAEYSMSIMEKGGEYRAPQWLIDQSAESRGWALVEEDLNTPSARGELRYGEIFSMIGRGFQWGTLFAQEGLRRAGDAIFGGEKPIDPAMAARPVVEYGVTVMPENGGVDWGKVGGALWTGEGQFIGEAIRENTSTKADRDLGYRIAGWVASEIPTVILSPWNLAHTGQVTARGVASAKESLLGGSFAATARAGRQARVYRFTDGRQMNEEWAAVRETVAERFGAGSAGDFGGSGDIADVLLTEIRDRPGQSTDEVIKALKDSPGFLDEMAFLAEQSGLAPWVTMRHAGMSAAEYAASRSREVAKVLDDGLAKVAPVIDQASLAFGYKDFWQTPAKRAWRMEARRGIYLGPVGVPLGPIAHRMGEGLRGGVEAIRKVEAFNRVIAPVSALKGATQAIFHFDHVATQTPAPGTMNALPDTVRIPHRMRKYFERHYRQQAATLQARASMSTYDLLAGARGAMPEEVDRKLITLMAEGGRTVQEQASYLVQHADTYGDVVGWRPKGNTPTEQLASALEKARGLYQETSRVQIHLDQIMQEMIRMGIMDDADEVANYVTHFFHGPAGGKAVRKPGELIAELEKIRVAAQQNPSKVPRGTTAIPRVGPVSVVDAMKLGYYQPELDIARLLHYRTTQGLKAELDGAMMNRISRTFGIPMLRGKEAAVRLIQAVRGTNRWTSEVGYASGVLTREGYVRDLLGVTRMIRDRAANYERTALAELAQELGVPMSKFYDERVLVGAMLESEKFLRRASSKLKSSLDKMMTTEARESLRSISREMLAHRGTMREAAENLKAFGVTIPDLANMSDAELSLLAQRMGERTQQLKGSIPAIERDLKVAQSALRASEAEAKKLGAALQETAAALKANVAERNKIAREWDKARKAAEDAGLNGHDLAQADDITKVRAKSPPVAPEASRQYRQIAPGDSVGGMTVLDDIPNQSSIASSLDDYEIVGLREIPMRGWAKSRYAAADDNRRVSRLADELRQSRSIKPLIVVQTADDMYVLEGGHRLGALQEMGAESFPALIVRDLDSFASYGKGRHSELFSAYKDKQRAYVANAQERKQLFEKLAYQRGMMNRQRSFLDKAKARVEAHKGAIRGAREEARDLAKRGKAAKTRATLLRSDLDKAADVFLESSRAYTEARRGLDSVLGSGQTHGVALALRGAAKRVAAHGQAVRAALASFESKHGVSAHVARQRALTPRTLSGAKGAMERRQEAGAKVIDPKKRAYLPHAPARDEAELLEYARAQDALDALEMSRAEQSALLWEVFGARTLTEVPLHELRTLADSSGPMRAAIIRFIVDPVGDATRKASRTMNLGEGTPAMRIARALGVDTAGSGEAVAARIEQAVNKAIKDAEKGSESAKRVLGAIPASDFAGLYHYHDMSRAARDVVGMNDDVRKWAATMSDRDRGALERSLRTTLIPLELGLAMKTLMGEGVFKASDGVKISLATSFGDKVASIAMLASPLTRGFKTSVIGYRASMLTGRRNSLFDGVRAMIQLGAWTFFSPSARGAFRADISSRVGKIQTASGLVDRATFQSVWEERGAALFGAMTDSLDDTARTLNNTLKEAKGRRFIEELKEVGEEGRRTRGVNIPRGAVKSAGLGGALGEAIADDLATGAALGFGFYGFAAGGFGARRVVHSSGRIATKTEWLAPIGPQAQERLDNTFRYFVYWTYVKSGMAPQDAMDLMLARMRDMTNLTPGERKIVQHLATFTPFMFYNFTKQNGIAQLARFLDNPAPTVAIMRTFRDISEDYGTDPDTRAFWQSLTDTIVREGKAWNMADETTAALNLLAPLTGLLEGATEGRPLSGFARGVMALGRQGDSAPIWQAIFNTPDEVALPLPLAAKILEQHGAFRAPGIRAYINEQGVPRVEVAKAYAYIVGITGAGVAINDVGRLQMAGAKGDHLQATLEALGLGRFYDQESDLSHALGLFTDQERRAKDVADWLESSHLTGDTVLDAIGLTPEEKAVAQLLIRHQNGKFVAEQITSLKAQFRAIQNKAGKALAGQTPVPDNN